MKAGKIVFALVLSVIMLFTFAGCGEDKPAITSDDFVSKMENRNLTITDSLSSQSDDLNLVKAYYADSEDKYRIEYYEFATDGDAKSAYNDTLDTINEVYEAAKIKTMVSNAIANYSKTVVTADGVCYIISRVGNTVIYSTASSEYKKTIENIIETDFDY